MKLRIAALALATCLAACGGDDAETIEDASRDSLRNAVAAEVRDAATRDRARQEAERDRRDAESIVGARKRCEAAAELPESLDRVMEEPREYVAGDSCTRQLLDGIVELYVESGGDEYLRTLDALSNVADSKATAVFGDALRDLFRARPVELLKHLYALQGDPTATEVDALLVTEIQLGRDDDDEAIHRIIDELERGDRLSTDEKRYLSRLESQLSAGS